MEIQHRLYMWVHVSFYQGQVLEEVHFHSNFITLLVSSNSQKLCALIIGPLRTTRLKARNHWILIKNSRWLKRAKTVLGHFTIDGWRCKDAIFFLIMDEKSTWISTWWIMDNVSRSMRDCVRLIFKRQIHDASCSIPFWLYDLWMRVKGPQSYVGMARVRVTLT
jgi:hypothetical protein